MTRPTRKLLTLFVGAALALAGGTVAPTAGQPIAVTSAESVRAGYPCAPLDIAILIDTTGSMDAAIENVKSQVSDLTVAIEEESGGDYRIGLIQFGEGVDVLAEFDDQNAEDVRDQIAGLSAGGGGEAPEAWDEALVTAVDSRSAGVAGDGQSGNFSVQWRSTAKKMIVIITDARPSGFDDAFDSADETRIVQAAVRASADDIRIATVFVPNGSQEDDAVRYLQRISGLAQSTYFATAADGSNLTEGLTLNVETCAEDTDGDGLFDVWETEGYDYDTGSGTAHVDLPGMGADPERKDLFVQINWMLPEPVRCILIVWCPANRDKSHSPDPAALRQIVQAFADAPVPNPDGSTGISLHIDAGPLTTAADAKLRTSDGGPIAMHTDVIVPDVPEDEFELSTFLDDYAAPWIAPERQALFTQVMYVHNILPANRGTSGYATGIPGDTAFIGSAELEGNTFFEAAVLMHELGHTLGLSHGGYDHLNRKPNYLSIMNYDAVFGIGLMRDGRDDIVDFSRYELVPLDESSLDERSGLELIDTDDPQAGLFDGEDAYMRCAGKGDEYPHITQAELPVDWNCDGDMTDVGVQGAVHPLADGESSTILTSRDDWATLTFTGGARGGLQSQGDPVGDEQLDFDEWLATPREYGVLAAGPGAVSTQPGTALLRFTVTNVGSEADMYALSAEMVGDWEGDASVRESVSVPAGTTVAFDVTATIPESASRDDSATVVLTAQSDGSDSMSASASGTIVIGEVGRVSVAGELTISPPAPTAGLRFTVTGEGFEPGTQAVVVSDDNAVPAAKTVVGDDGSISVQLVAPASPGSIVLRAVGVEEGDGDDLMRAEQPRVLEAEVEVGYANVGLVVLVIAGLVVAVAVVIWIALIAAGAVKAPWRRRESDSRDSEAHS